jgi:hypothetical protein
LELHDSTMATIGFLNREARPGQVVVSPFDGPLLALTRLRVPFFSVYPLSFAASEAVTARSRDVADFREAWKRCEVREDLLARSRTDWIVSRRQLGSLAEQNRIALNTVRLDRVYANPDFAVHHVARLSGEERLSR